MKPTFTLGIEEEYQTVDPETRDLRSHIHAEIIEKGKLVLQERVKTEMHQSVVEVGTSVCANIKEAREELKKLAAAHDPAVAGEWSALGGGGDPSICGLASAGSYSRRALQEYCAGHAAGGPRQPDFRAARARRASKIARR